MSYKAISLWHLRFSTGFGIAATHLSVGATFEVDSVNLMKQDIIKKEVFLEMALQSLNSSSSFCVQTNCS